MTYPTKERITYCYLGNMKLRSVTTSDFPEFVEYAMPGHKRVQDRFEPPVNLNAKELKDLGQRLGVDVIFKSELVSLHRS